MAANLAASVLRDLRLRWADTANWHWLAQQRQPSLRCRPGELSVSFEDLNLIPVRRYRDISNNARDDP